MLRIRLLILNLVFCHIVIYGQQINLELQEDLQCGSNTLCMDVVLSSADNTAFKIGTSSIFITYNHHALQFDSYESLNFNGSDLCVVDAAAAWGEHDYDALSIPGEINMTLTLLNNAYSCPEILQNTNVSQICFQILDSKLDPNIQFHLGNTNFNSAITNNGTAAIAKATMTEISGSSSLNCSPLPLQWLSLRAQHMKEYNNIEWSVGNSSETLSFEILRSVDNSKNFKPIGITDNAKTKNYFYQDFDISPYITYYYQIKQIEKSGREYYSDLVTVKSVNHSDRIETYPNPTYDYINIDLDSKQNEEIQLTLFDLEGKSVLSRTVGKDKNNLSYKMNLSHLLPGVYLLETQSVSIQDLRQIIILK